MRVDVWGVATDVTYVGAARAVLYQMQRTLDWQMSMALKTTTKCHESILLTLVPLHSSHNPSDHLTLPPRVRRPLETHARTPAESKLVLGFSLSDDLLLLNECFQVPTPALRLEL